MSKEIRQTPFDECVKHIERTRTCVEFGGIRPITKLCLECPKAIIYDRDDLTSWDCILDWEDNHDEYFVSPNQGC